MPAVRPAAERGFVFCFVSFRVSFVLFRPQYMRGAYMYTYLRVYLYIAVCVAGGVAKLRARRAAGRQPELTTEWVPVKQVEVSRLRDGSFVF